MDYYNMNKEELIQEILMLRSENTAFINAAKNHQNEIIQLSPFEIQPELYCRFSPELKYKFVNEAYTYFLKQKRESFIDQSITAWLPNNYHRKTISILQKLNPANPVATVEYNWKDNDGQTRWWRWTVRAIYSEDNLLIEYHAVGRDVTEHKEAEEEIRERLNIEHAIAEASKLLVGVQEADYYEILRIIGKAIKANHVYIYKITEERKQVPEIYERCDDDTRSVLNGLINNDPKNFPWGLSKFKQGETIVIENTSNLPSEAESEKKFLQNFDIQASLVVPIHGLDGKLLGYIGFNDTQKNRMWKNEDIKCLHMLAELLGAYWDRKYIEQALKVSEAQFRTLTETAPAIIFVWEPSMDKSLLYLNTGYTSISGYPKEEAFYTNYWDFVHPDHRSILKARGLARLKGEEVPGRYELKFVSKNGDQLWGDLALTTIEWNGKPAVMGVICDVTERKQMEVELRQAHDELENRVIERTSEIIRANEKLRQEIAEREKIEQELLLSETRYRAIVEDQSELLARLLPDGTITFGNEAFCKFFGKNAYKLIGQNAADLIHPEDRHQIVASLKAVGPDYLEDIFPLRTLRADGETCWLEWSVRAIVKNQELIEIQAVGRDYSARKHAEEALLRSEENFRKLAETSPVLIAVFNEDKFLYLNSTFETMTDFAREEIMQMTPWERIHPDYQDLARKNNLFRRQGEKVPPYEVLIQGSHDIEIWGYIYADTIEYEGHPATLAIIVDITERKKMEEDLLQTSKLESLGILAGGIAHDFNNILTVISGNVSLAKMIMDTDDEVAEILTEVEQAAFQARDLTQQLLTFSKGGAPIKETSTIQDLLRETTSFVLRGSNVSCHYDIADNLWPVSIDKGQISQVINNLIINADQAMPEGGVIELKAENIDAGSELPASLKPASYIKITIKDYGIGIVEKHLLKIFDPYFTTKQKGHGLGLATCYSIIKRHDGEINISSAVGLGTTATIYLPAFPEQIVQLKKPLKLDFYGQGKILIMDDEEVVRDTLGKMLQHLGYTIRMADNGMKAIDLYRKAMKRNEPYDIVLMDLTIAGGMGGKEAVKRLLELDPKARVIVSSGYSNDPVMANYKDYGFCGVLPKPYEIQAVNKILYEVLDKEKKQKASFS